jgi:hypothetical protein
MSDIDSLQGEQSNVSEEVLSNLSSEERVHAFLREAPRATRSFSTNSTKQRLNTSTVRRISTISP